MTSNAFERARWFLSVKRALAYAWSRTEGAPARIELRDEDENLLETLIDKEAHPVVAYRPQSAEEAAE